MIDPNFAKKVTEGKGDTILHKISPETVESNYYFYPSDVWSLGVTFFLAATDKHPFKGNNGQEIIKSIKTDEPLRLNSSDQTLNYIVNKSLTKNLYERITLDEIDEILSKVWF